MTPAINLLPPRRPARRRSRASFQRAVLAALALGLGLAGLLYLGLRERVASQRALNAVLTRDIGLLQAQLRGVATLEAEIDAWAALRAERDRSVRLLAALAPLLPAGVYLKSLRQEGETVTLRGVARSEASVSELLRRLAAPASDLRAPELVEITALPITLAIARPSDAAPAEPGRPAQARQFTLRARLPSAAGAESAR